MLYSLSAMTSYGHANLFLAQHWQLMGAIEALNGMMLFGLSTAFLFAVLRDHWPTRGIDKTRPVAHRLECFGDPSRRAVRIFVSRGQALSAGPARPAEILPGTAIHIALRIEGLRTRVFRGIELEHHPLRVWNARIRGLVQ